MPIRFLIASVLVHMTCKFVCLCVCCLYAYLCLHSYMAVIRIFIRAALSADTPVFLFAHQSVCLFTGMVEFMHCVHMRLFEYASLCPRPCTSAPLDALASLCLCVVVCLYACLLVYVCNLECLHILLAGHLCVCSSFRLCSGLFVRICVLLCKYAGMFVS